MAHKNLGLKHPSNANGMRPFATASMSANTQAPIMQESPLLSLPAEIRNHIWTLVVVENDTIIANKQNLSTLFKRRSSRLPGITQTSRQSRSESLPIYLDQNIFQFSTFCGERGSEHKLFGPLFYHLSSTRRIEFSYWAPNQVFRLVREKDWANVVVETVGDGIVLLDYEYGKWLQDFARSGFRIAMEDNADGKVHPKDFAEVAAYLD